MKQYDVIVRNLSESYIPIYLKKNTIQIPITINTLTPGRIYIEAYPSSNELVLSETSIEIAERSYININHRMRMRDRIAVDGKERLYVSLIDNIGIDSQLDVSAIKDMQIQNDLTISSVAAISAVKYATLGEVENVDGSDVDLATLDKLMLEDIDYTES